MTNRENLLNGSRSEPVYKSGYRLEDQGNVANDAAIVAFNTPAAATAVRTREDEADVTAAGPRASADRRAAFEPLMKAHERRVLATAWRLLGRLEDAQDAAQEVFLRLYRYLDRFDAGRPLEPWLYRVTVNVCHDFGRRGARRPVSLEEVEPGRPLVAVEPDPGEAAFLAEERRIVERALDTLAEKERAAIVLRDVQGLTTAEVAEALGSTPTTVRSQICRARLKIKEYRDQKLERRPR